MRNEITSRRALIIALFLFLSLIARGAHRRSSAARNAFMRSILAHLTALCAAHVPASSLTMLFRFDAAVRTRPQTCNGKPHPLAR